MSGETKASVSSWTIDSLREHMLTVMAEAEKRFDQRFTAQQQSFKEAMIAQKEAVAAALASSEKAVAVAEVNAEKWRASANEWRGAMNDRERSLMPRLEAEGLFKSNAEKIEALQARMDRSEGKALMGYPALEQAMKDVSSLRSSQDMTTGTTGGRASQQQMFLVIIPALVVMLISIIGAIVAVAYAVKVR